MAKHEAPLPASVTKHLDELRHVLPGRMGEGCVLTLRQASKAADSGSRMAGAVSGILHAPRPTSSPLPSSHTGTTPTPIKSTDTDKEAGSTGTTGTTLWLGAQIMSIYLESILPPPTSSYTSTSSILTGGARRKQAIELGSGIGYLSLYLASKGYDVLATDIEPSLSSVLAPNVEHGKEVIRMHHARIKGGVEGVGEVRVGEIDWMVSPDVSAIHEPGSAAGLSNGGCTTECAGNCKTARGAGAGKLDTKAGPIDDKPSEDTPSPEARNAMQHLANLVGDGLDMIITTDTLYAPVIVEPLWRTIYHLSHLSAVARARRYVDGGDTSSKVEGAEVAKAAAGVALKDNQNAGPSEPFSTLTNDLTCHISAPSPPAPSSTPTPTTTNTTPASPSSLPNSTPPAPPAALALAPPPPPAKPSHPQILIALENRDPALISSALSYGASIGFELRRVPQSKLSKALREAGWGWGKEDWEGVELWKGAFKGRR